MVLDHIEHYFCALFSVSFVPLSENLKRELEEYDS